MKYEESEEFEQNHQKSTLLFTSLKTEMHLAMWQFFVRNDPPAIATFVYEPSNNLDAFCAFLQVCGVKVGGKSLKLSRRILEAGIDGDNDSGSISGPAESKVK